MNAPDMHNRPLKIIHGIPRFEGKIFEDRCEFVRGKLAELKAKGFGGIVSNVSWYNYTKDEEEWQIFKFVADECERMGMRLWIYDEDGYPSGGAGGLTVAANPDFETTGVVIVTKDLAPGEIAEIQLPKAHMHFLSLAIYTTDGGIDGISDFEPIERIPCRMSRDTQRIRNNTDKTAVACAFVQKRLYEGTHCVHNVFEARRYIDVTYREAVHEFLNNTYQKYYDYVGDRMDVQELGGDYPEIGKIEAVFTDEPSLMGCYINAGLYPGTTRDKYDETIPMYPVISWGHDFENKFESLCGYSPLDNLIYKFTGKSDAAKRYRYDYHRVLSYLFETSFYAQISDWCASHKLNFSGHILLEDDIRQHVLFEGNYFSFLRHMHYPGIDMLQSIPEVIYDTYSFTPKLISSVAEAYNRRHVMSEVSAHAQGGKVTIPQQYTAVCLQYAFGVDVFTYYYSEDFMDTDTYAKYNASHGRIDSIMRGKTIADIMLYYPIETFGMHHLGSDRQYGIYTHEENVCHDTLQDLIDTFQKSGIDYHFTDYEYLSNCRVENAQLVTPTGRKYKSLILPAMEYTSQLAGLLSEYSAQGLQILSLTGDCFADCEYSEIFANAHELVGVLDRTDSAIVINNTPERVAVLTRDTNDGRRFMFVNATPEPAEISATIRGIDSPVLVSPLENSIIPATFEKTSDGYKVKFTISGYDTLIIKN